MSMTNIQTNRTFNVNRLLSLPYWTGESFTINSDNSVTIAPDGFIQTSLQYQALGSAAYRLLHIVYEGHVNEASNIANKQAVEFLLQMKYLDDAGNICYERFAIPLTKESSELISENPNTYQVDKTVACTQVDSQFITAVIINNTSANVKIKEVSLRQSYDLQSSQLMNSLAYQSRLKSMVKYNNGFNISYYGYETPVVIRKSTDALGNFNGWYVGENNEQFIPCDVIETNM